MTRLVTVASWCTAPLFVLAGCVPMTFSHDEAVDFDQYRTVGVQVDLQGQAGFWGAAEATSYLMGELEETSGFERVVLASAPADLYLVVNLSLVIEETYDADEGETEIEYEGEASFTSYKPRGARVDGGHVEDSSATAVETLEDTLDEVALHYLAPYRL